MEIFKGTMEDVKELNHLLTLLIRDEKQYDDNIDINFEVKNMYENYIYDNTKLILVAKENGKVVGYIYGIIKPNQENENVKEGHLDALYVIDEYRNKGIANLLIEKFFSWLKENKIKKAYVKVWTNNTKAKNLYEKNNFKTVNETLMCEVE